MADKPFRVGRIEKYHRLGRRGGQCKRRPSRRSARQGHDPGRAGRVLPAALGLRTRQGQKRVDARDCILGLDGIRCMVDELIDEDDHRQHRGTRAVCSDAELHF